MRGIPTYTQHTVAWQGRVPMHEPSVIEEINISFNAKGGGTWGEFSLVWHNFGPMYSGDKRDHQALKVAAFTDGMNAMLDDRILPIIRRLAARKRDLPEVEPTKVIEMLEEAGVRPSEYHLRGLYEPTCGRPEFWPKEARKAYNALMKHERGD